MILTRSQLSLALAAALALLGAPAHAAPDAAATHRFEQVVHDFYERYLATHPEEATQLGDHRFDRRSGDSSAAGIAADRKLYRKTLDVIQAIPASSLPPDHAVDVAVERASVELNHPEHQRHGLVRPWAGYARAHEKFQARQTDSPRVARRLRADDRLRHCLMVAITGYGDVADREKARAAGFTHHLTKPADPARVAALIATGPAAASNR